MDEKMQELSVKEMELIEKIATTTIIGLETLEARNSDRLDFCEVSVWDLRAALEKAYIAGKESLKLDKGE